MYAVPQADSCMAAARRKRALTPYRFSAATNASPSGGSDVVAFRYSLIAQADAPLTDSRFVSRLIEPLRWYFFAQGMRASTVGTTKVISSAAASMASMKRGRRIEFTVSHVQVIATWSHDREFSVWVRPITWRGRDADSVARPQPVPN